MFSTTPASSDDGDNDGVIRSNADNDNDDDDDDVDDNDDCNDDDDDAFMLKLSVFMNTFLLYFDAVLSSNPVRAGARGNPNPKFLFGGL